MGNFVIVNPASGGGRAQSRWPEISRLLRETAGPFDHVITTRPGEATNVARAAIKEGADLVIAVGGDGTVNEVLNGFAGTDGKITQKCAFAAIPCGTGSDFMRGLGFGTGPLPAIERIGKRIERKIDVGRIEFATADGMRDSRLFLNVASFGFSASVCHNLNRAPRSRILPLRVTFLAETLRALKVFRPAAIRLTVDGTVIERDVMLVAFANGRYFGGGMLIAPQADMEDGLFDVIVLKAISKSRLIRKIAHVYRGTHLRLPEIEVYSGKAISAAAIKGKGDVPVYIETDGESAGQLDCVISMLPQALRFAQ